MRPLPLADNEIGNAVSIDVSHAVPCNSVERHAASILVLKLSITMWRTKEMSPLAARFCSNQARPKPCASRAVTTSFRPSPFTS